MEGQVAEMAKLSGDCVFEIMVMAMGMTKFDVTHLRHEALLIRVNQTNDPEVPLCDKSDGLIPFIV